MHVAKSWPHVSHFLSFSLVPCVVFKTTTTKYLKEQCSAYSKCVCVCTHKLVIEHTVRTRPVSSIGQVELLVDDVQRRLFGNVFGREGRELHVADDVGNVRLAELFFHHSSLDSRRRPIKTTPTTTTTTTAVTAEFASLIDLPVRTRL